MQSASWLVVCALAVAVSACGSTEATPPRATPTTRPVVPTQAPAPTAVDYVALRARLLVPLGPLIVAVRENSPDQAASLAAFDAAAERVLPVIERDVSTNGNRLHSVVVNTREAAARKDVAALERRRLLLLEVQ